MIKSGCQTYIKLNIYSEPKELPFNSILRLYY